MTASTVLFKLTTSDCYYFVPNDAEPDPISGSRPI